MKQIEQIFDPNTPFFQSHKNFWHLLTRPHYSKKLLELLNFKIFPSSKDFDSLNDQDESIWYSLLKQYHKNRKEITDTLFKKGIKPTSAALLPANKLSIWRLLLPHPDNLPSKNSDQILMPGDAQKIKANFCNFSLIYQKIRDNKIKKTNSVPLKKH